MVGTLEAAFVAENTPGAVPVPDDGSAIGQDEPVRFRFSDAMDPTSLELSGSLVETAYDVRWETVVFDNDTLVLEPESMWPLYSDPEVTVVATSRAGYRSRDARARFSVVGDTIFVSAAQGDDAAPGSPSRPLARISEAVARARNRADSGFSGTQRVHVASGTYREELELYPTIELYGGYDESFGSRVPGTSVVIGPSDALQSISLVSVELGLFEAVVDGFDVREPEGAVEGVVVVGGSYGEVLLRNSTVISETVPAVYLLGAITVRLDNSVVRGPSSGTVAIFSDGSNLIVEDSEVTLPEVTGHSMTSLPTIWVQSSLVQIERSRVVAPRGEVGRSTAILIDDSDTVIRDSLVDGGSGLTTKAVFARGGAVRLENLTIRVGQASDPSATSSAGIDFRYFVENDATGSLDALGVSGIEGNNLSVRNSIIFGAGAANSVGVVHGDLVTIRNNVFDSLDAVAVQSDAFGNTTAHSANELNALAGDSSISASENEEVTPLLANPASLSNPTADWRLTAGSPERVRRGGTILTQAGTVARDADGVERGDVWAVGAYEYE